MKSNQQNSVPSIKEYETRLAGLYEEYYDKLAHYVYVRIGNRSEAEDIAGEVFLKALKSLNSYREQGIPMQGWLFRIAHNMTVDYLRKMDKRKTVPLDSLILPDDSNPADRAEKNIDLGRLTEAMKQLTPDQREVINFRFFSGLTSKETGELMNKSDGAVREMQRAAIEKLRKIMGLES